MSGRNVKTKMKRFTLLLGVSVLLVWGVFYLQTIKDLRQTSSQHIQQVSEQIIARLEVELLGLENLSFTLARHPAVHALLGEQDLIAYHEKSGAVDELIDTLRAPADFADHLIVSGGDAVSCFGGMLGQTALRQTQTVFDGAGLPRYTAITLEGVRYIGYAREIQPGQAPPGTLCLLMREDKLLGLFREYVAGDDLWIVLAENGVAVTSGEPALRGREVAQLQADSALFLRRNVGISPFEICVGADARYLRSATLDFGAAALITAGFFTALLAMYLTVANRHFFRPMLDVIQDVELLGAGQEPNRLQKTGQEPFDGLVEQVNRMLIRLEERTQALLDTQATLKNTEIERQRSLIISLKKQINAHFTVNILNIVKVLAQQGEMEKAAQMADGLSHLLRHANDEDEFSSGMEELYLLEKYVTIMEIRYPGRFVAEFDWDDRLVHAKLPRMLLQPIVENAIIHGFGDMAGGGVLEITGVLQGETALFTIRDNGKGMPREELARLQGEIARAKATVWNVGGTEHIALANIQRRMWSHYGESCMLRLESAPGQGTTVSLAIPTYPPDPAV